MLISCKPWAAWPSRMYIIFLPRNSDRTVTVTEAEWVSRCLWDHSIVTDHHPNYKRARCVSCLPSHKWIYACFLSVRALVLYPSPGTLGTTFTANLNRQEPTLEWPVKCLDFSQNGAAKNYFGASAWLLICKWGSLAFAGIWGPPITE